MSSAFARRGSKGGQLQLGGSPRRSGEEERQALLTPSRSDHYVQGINNGRGGEERLTPLSSPLSSSSGGWRSSGGKSGGGLPGAAGATTGASKRTSSLRVQCVTWNMNEKSVPESADMRAMIEEDGLGAASDIDVYAFGVQEGHASFNSASLKPLLQDKYVMLASRTLVGIQLHVYVKRTLMNHFTSVHHDVEGTGIGNMYGNKGGVGVRCTYSDTYGNDGAGGDGAMRIRENNGERDNCDDGAASSSNSSSIDLLFVSSHFAAHQDNIKERNDDYHRIERGLFSKNKEGNAATISSSFSRQQQRVAPSSKKLRGHASYRHCVTFWMGDLNYRIDGNRKAIDMALKTGMTEVLASNDQLQSERRKKTVFDKFNEGHITFMPTYKFDPGTDIYDTSAKARIPSYTDRILWVINALDVDVLQRKYWAVKSLKCSDHRPVAASFDVKMNRGNTMQQSQAMLLSKQQQQQTSDGAGGLLKRKLGCFGR